MAKWLPGEVMHRFKTRFTRLYGETAPRCLERLAMLVGRYGVGIDPQPTPYRWDQRDAVLITYGDMVQAPSEKPLLTLHRFLTHHLQGVINTVHILPFFQDSSDDGFSVIDYRTVNPALGTWQDIQAIGADFRLMVD
ncbi:MAG: sugar phosphorylase, partial [Nitrospinota bacterium]